MFKKIQKHAYVIMVLSIVLSAGPTISNAASDKNLGRDWYCSEPEEHTAEYQKHAQYHIEQGADAIAGDLEKLFSNQSLTADEKHKETVEILNRYLLKVKAGMGD